MSRLAWLGTDKAPLYVSFFFAALAWTLVRTADRVAATPIVEYQVDFNSDTFVSNGHANLLGVRFRNMTYSRPTNCLVVFLNVAPQQIAGKTPLELLAMTRDTYRISGNVFARARAQINDQQSAQLMLDQFPPGADVEFGVVASGQGKVNIKASNCESGASHKTGEGTEAMPVILERSIKTRMIEHELHALWGGLGLWAVALFGLATVRAKRGIHGDI